MALRLDDFSINTIIGPGSSINGDMKISGSIRIDGDLCGNLETDGNVQIGEFARIKGNITAKSIIVGGIVIGDITVKESVKLLSSSAVVGDVLARSIQLDENVVFHGHCIAVKDDARYDQLSSEFLTGKSIRRKVSAS
ncbi:MAG: polymer-forming cytoskeletal protein [Treponema sp.]|nr:polymer-forming cytoskeletal protein [Treponema sp.]